jgi:hypothetical protein
MAGSKINLLWVPEQLVRFNLTRSRNSLLFPCQLNSQHVQAYQTAYHTAGTANPHFKIHAHRGAAFPGPAFLGASPPTGFRVAAKPWLRVIPNCLAKCAASVFETQFSYDSGFGPLKHAREGEPSHSEVFLSLISLRSTASLLTST